MKSVDLLFTRRLTTYSGQIHQLIASDRIVLLDTDSLTDDSRLRVLQKFITEHAIANSNIPDVYPDSVLHALNAASKDGVTIAGMNAFLGVLRMNDFAILFIERDDLVSEDPDPDFALKAFALDNVSYPSEIVECYAGTGFLYDEENKLSATALDFIDSFTLDADDLALNNLTGEYASFQVLRSNNKLRDLDDTNMKKFLSARGMEYYQIYR